MRLVEKSVAAGGGAAQTAEVVMRSSGAGKGPREGAAPSIRRIRRGSQTSAPARRSGHVAATITEVNRPYSRPDQALTLPDSDNTHLAGSVTRPLSVATAGCANAAGVTGRSATRKAAAVSDAKNSGPSSG